MKKINDHLKDLTKDIKQGLNGIKDNIPTFKQDPNKEIKVYKEKKPIGKFLDKKRIIIFSLMFIMMIVLVIVTVTFITNVNVHTIISTISKIQNHTNAIIAGWILLLILAGICRYIWQIESIRMRLKHYLVNTSIWEWVNFGIIVLFINTITIFALGSDPYKLWWMTKRGLRIHEASAILLSSGWIIQLTQMIISYPSLGYLIYLYFYNPAFVHTYDTNVSMCLVCVGYCNDIMVFCVLTFLGFNLHIQLLIAKVFNWLRKRLGFSYKSKEVLRLEFIDKAKFQKVFIKEMKSFEADFYIAFWTVIALLLYYFSTFFSLELLLPYFPNERVHILANLFWSTYNFANVGTVANNFIPIPGSEGTIQFVLISLFNSSISGIGLPANVNLTTTIKQTVFLWRVFNYYLIVIFGCFYCLIRYSEIWAVRYYKKRQLIKNGWFEMKNS